MQSFLSISCCLVKLWVSTEALEINRLFAENLWSDQSDVFFGYSLSEHIEYLLFEFFVTYDKLGVAVLSGSADDISLFVM